MSLKKIDVRLFGVIGKPHGINGEVTVKMLTDYPELIQKGDTVFLDETANSGMDVENVRSKIIKGKKIIILKFFFCNNRDYAETIRGKSLYRVFDLTDGPGENKFWVDDLLNCNVYTINKECIGTVKDINSSYSNDNLVIKKVEKTSGKKHSSIELLVPMLDEYIEAIDIKNKKIILKKIPEYI
jgi:16S rRNA processing protein RimM